MDSPPMLSLALLLLLATWIALPILAAAFAASYGAPEPTAPLPTPIGAAISLSALGLTWRRHRAVQTGRGPRVFWLGDGDEVQYGRAYKLCRKALRDLGFSWGTPEPGNGTVQPVCWEGTAASGAAMDAALAAADEALAKDNERRVG